MLLHDDLVYQILQWLPVISLLRFKLVCRAWRALIESNDFIKQHLHHHHYDPNLKDKNHSLIHMVDGKDPPFPFPLISIDSFKESYVQLDFSDLSKYLPLEVVGTVSYNGIVCLNLIDSKRKHCICLWNPATKQSRVLPQSPVLTLEKENGPIQTTVGVGFDVKNNDYKVVNLCSNCPNNEERVEVYSLNTNSWTSVTTVFPFKHFFRDPRVPFNNGTCFFWNVMNFNVDFYFCFKMIPCYDFRSEKIHYIPFPNVSEWDFNKYAIVLSDKMAFVSHSYGRYLTNIWVLNGYGSVDESWVKLYTIDPLLTIDKKMSVQCLWMNGNYLTFGVRRSSRPYDDDDDDDDDDVIMAYRYNVVTKEMKNLSTSEICVNHDLTGLTINFYNCNLPLVAFKESLLSVGKGNNECIK